MTSRNTVPIRTGVPLDWSQLEFFHALAGASTLAGAARRIGVTASAVSQRLTSIERAVGTTLMSRSRSGLHPTDAGQRLLIACEAMHSVAQNARDSVHPARGLTGTLRLSCPAGLADGLIVPALAAWLQLHPALRYEVLATDTHVDMKEAGIDLSLRLGWVRDGDFVARKLVSCAEVVCASPAYLQANGVPLTPADLSRHAWIGWAGFGRLQRLAFRKPGGGVARVEVQSSVSTTSAASIVHWLCAGAGLSRQPEMVVREQLRCGRLVAVLGEYGLPGPTLFAVYRKTADAHRIRPLVQHLATELHQITSGAPGH